MKRRAAWKKPPPRPRRERDPDEFASFQVQRPRVRMAQRLDQEAPVTVEKEEPARHEGYRRLVAALPCIHCGRAGPSQAAHADTGKGALIKSDDRTCYPACATSVGRRGCHDIIGDTGAFSKWQRRELEVRYAAATRAKIIAAGDWPADLERWPGDASTAG